MYDLANREISSIAWLKNQKNENRSLFLDTNFLDSNK